MGKNLMFKGSLQILQESAENEGYVFDTLNESVENDSINDILDDFEDIDEDELDYTEEMVNVIEQQLDNTSRYLIEHDNLSKFIKSSGLSLKDAMIKICEHNDIPFANTYLVIESKDDIMKNFAEAGKAAKEPKMKEKLKKKIEVSKKQLKNLKDNGIKVLKKKK